VALAQICRGWALTRIGRPDEGVPELEQGIAGWRATGFETWQSWYGALLAESYLAEGRVEEACAAIETQLERIAHNGERQFESLLLLVKGDALLARDEGAAEALYGQALMTAQRQDGLAWQLRAALRLAGLWRERGDSDRARAALAPVRARLSEGFARPDLCAAEALLAEAG
jgi:ATP/maltotriose-dependent transcriptional regulator MalT